MILKEKIKEVGLVVNMYTELRINMYTVGGFIVMVLDNF